MRVLADQLDERAARLAGRLHAVAGELLGDPLRQLALAHLVDEELAGLRAGLRERRVLAELLGDEREHGVGRGRGQVLGDRLRVRRLPALDLFDDDEPAAAAEEPHRVAGRDRVVAGRVPRGEPLDRVLAEPVAEAAEGALDLRAVAAGEQVGRFELVRHERQA